MAGTELSAPPALSTPAEHLFEHVRPDVSGVEDRKSADKLRDVYEIARTAREIRDGRWSRMALQFPDAMLGDAPGVVEALREELQTLEKAELQSDPDTESGGQARIRPAGGSAESGAAEGGGRRERKFYILADTSYSSCCVDEIAAEHVDAEAVVHYGRACLSPTSRLPVIYVFTKHPLDHDAVVEAFEKEIPRKEADVVLMADVTYQDHVPALASLLRDRGYQALLSTEVVHEPTGRVPNRAIVNQEGNKLSDPDLKDYDIFHISDPPTALLLVLSSRIKALHIFPTNLQSSSTPISTISGRSTTPAARLLGRRYARVLTLSTAAIIGILVNTLSVSNYLSSVASIRGQIAAAGKKSYTVVVGKLNPAKLANFAEIDGWVVVGCWESSLIEDDAGFYRPVVTPFELSVALQGDDRRVWSGEWWGGIERVGEVEGVSVDNLNERPLEEQGDAGGVGKRGVLSDGTGGIEEEESEPPEFDLRTGRLVSHRRLMRIASSAANATPSRQEQPMITSGALTVRPKSELATVNGVVSPGAEFLRSQRTWTGLGSDFDIDESSTAIEEGRGGVARAYTVGGDQERR